MDMSKKGSGTTKDELYAKFSGGVQGTNADGNNPQQKQSPSSNTEEKYKELAEIQKQEVRIFVFVALILAALTLYFFFVNCYIILRDKPKPYTLEAVTTIDKTQHVSYSAFMSWQRPKQGLHPVLKMNETLIPDTGKSLPISLTEKHKVTIEMPGELPPGMYVGDLNLQRESGPANLPKLIKIPVSINLTGGILHNWAILFWWLIAAAIAFLALYILSLIILVKPSGYLTGTVLHNNRRSKIKISLKKCKIAYLFPWKQSQIPLYKLLKEGNIPVSSSLKGEIRFINYGIPSIWIFGKGNYGFYYRYNSNAIQDELSWQILGIYATIFSESEYKMETRDKKFQFQFSYNKEAR